MMTTACGTMTCGTTCGGDADDEMPPFLAGCVQFVRPNGSIVGSDIADHLRPRYPTLLSAVPSTINQSGPAFLASIDGRVPITHKTTSTFLLEFGDVLKSLGIGKGHRVAVVLPNGPELALAILAVSTYTSCVPLSATGATQELAADLLRAGADLIIGPYCAGPLPMVDNDDDDDDEEDDITPELKEMGERFGVMADAGGNATRDWTVHHTVQDVADELGIPFVGLVPDPRRAGPFKLWVPPLGDRKKTRSTLRTHQNVPLRYNDLAVVPGKVLIVVGEDENEDDEDGNNNKTTTTKTTSNAGKTLMNDMERFKPNTGHDEALILFTSGTTGNKKLVPHEMGDVLTAAATIALSWELLPTDVNCNLMPLFHVGGILRQVYSPLVSGGTVICCPSFDADIFWSLLKRQAFNWYYAAPTMHQIILQTGKATMGVKEMKSHAKLKMIANAAGGLLPSLAQEMRDTFGGAAVLPSYGMTECMPISSPPASYALTKPGTSGVPVGPEVAILNTATMEPFPVREEGPICVRGDPCFRGYQVLANDPSDTKKPESFLAGGWFNTGDLGFLDEDGYLYITGRSKEVINRGGEIISPMEVEEAITSHPDVRACAAFAADHDVLQEVVGIVIVPETAGPRSLDLPTLHAYIAEKLATPKWPQCLVFMEDGLPKSHTNKLLRVKLGSRLGLPEFSDTMSYWERTFEAKCPEQGAPLTDPIPSQRVATDPHYVEKILRSVTKSQDLWVVRHPQRPGALVAHVGKGPTPKELIQIATDRLHRYEVPTHICAVDRKKRGVTADELAKINPNPKDAVASILSASSGSGVAGGDDPFVSQVQDIFLELLGLDYIPAPDADFFQIGGSSMTASQLASKIRKNFGVACAGAEVFHHSTSIALVELIRARTGGSGTTDDSPQASSFNRRFHLASFESTRLAPRNTYLACLIQLVPMFFVFPVWQISRYLLFFGTLLQKAQWFPWVSDRDFASFLLAYMAFHMLWITFAPLVFVAVKWVVIGKYKAGRYPIWGQYYLRWWIVDVCRKVFLRGIWGSSDTTLRWYYRMLGAKIEPGARIGLDCHLAEYDLVTVGENAAVELSTLRGFGVDNGCMLLGYVKVGKNASVGYRSVVAPNTSVPDGQHLGPGISTYDDTPDKASNPKHARVNRKMFHEPILSTILFYGLPLTFLVDAAGQIPPMMVTYALLHYKSRANSEFFFSNWNELMDWLCDPRRLPFFFGIRLARALLSPFFYMAFALLVKRYVIGTFEPGQINPHCEWDRFRLWLAASLFPRKKVQAVTDLIGRHYENVSIFYRLLGAKVGKRVFWPGNQPNCNGIFDLLEIGDDVVFGSRSALFTTSVDRRDKIILCAGANVSDNCIVMPGAVISKNAVLGSNSICPEGKFLAAGSVWFGTTGAESVCLEPGDGSDALQYQRLGDEKPTGDDPLSKEKFGYDKMVGPPVMASQAVDLSQLQMVGDETTIRPFGKAVYKKGAKGYSALPIPVIVTYTLICRIFCCIFHTLPLLLAIQFGAVLLYSNNVLATTYEAIFGDGHHDAEGGKMASKNGVVFNEDYFLWFQRDFENDGHHHTYGDVFLAVLVCYLFCHFLRVIAWLIIELSAKWLIMGKRRPGRYNYDTSSYAQRWEIYQLTAKIRKLGRLNLLQFIAGSPYMNWYFRLNGSKVGKDVCLYPSGADPMMPEPDMVKIGDRVVIDCSSVVCHLNTRGNFELVPIVIESECTLRAYSRVQQGVHMETGSMLLEKSIAMTGEVLDKRSVWQGGPATMWLQYPEHEQVRFLYTPPKADDISKDIEMGSFTL